MLHFLWMEKIQFRYFLDSDFIHVFYLILYKLKFICCYMFCIDFLFFFISVKWWILVELFIFIYHLFLVFIGLICKAVCFVVFSNLCVLLFCWYLLHWFIKIVNYWVNLLVEQACNLFCIYSNFVFLDSYFCLTENS